jgi:LysM repeat protein
MPQRQAAPNFGTLASECCQWQNRGLMKSGWIGFAGLCSLVLLGSGFAQSLAPTPKPPGSAVDLQTLAKKIDEQNAKIDLLSQQILKLQQQIAGNSRPGVIIGEVTPASSPTPMASEPARATGSGISHIVARGETLTSIAKAYAISVADLQKANHIDNPLKLQAGQTLLIPGNGGPSPSASAGD